MKFTRKFLNMICMTVFLFAFHPLILASDSDDAAIVYALAVKSIKEGDCIAGLRAISKYQSLAAGQLQENPEFKKKIDEQFKICLQKLSEDQNRRIRQGLSMENKDPAGRQQLN